MKIRPTNVLALASAMQMQRSRLESQISQIRGIADGLDSEVRATNGIGQRLATLITELRRQASELARLERATRLALDDLMGVDRRGVQRAKNISFLMREALLTARNIGTGGTSASAGIRMPSVTMMMQMERVTAMGGIFAPLALAGLRPRSTSGVNLANLVQRNISLSMEVRTTGASGDLNNFLSGSFGGLSNITGRMGVNAVDTVLFWRSDTVLHEDLAGERVAKLIGDRSPGYSFLSYAMLAGQAGNLQAILTYRAASNVTEFLGFENATHDLRQASDMAREHGFLGNVQQTIDHVVPVNVDCPFVRSPGAFFTDMIQEMYDAPKRWGRNIYNGAREFIGGLFR